MPYKVNSCTGAHVEFSPGRRVALIQIAALVFLAGGAKGSSSAPIQVTVSNETVPPGCSIQLKFYVSKPSLVASGSLSVDLDPAIFSSAAAATIFSANGDAYGLVQINGLHLDLQFGSQSGGIGQLPGVPIAVVTATVLPTARPGQTASVAASGTSGWSDPHGNSYSVSFSAGTVTIGGALSITSVNPGGGVLPAGATIDIEGTGFGDTTTAQIDGASIASQHVTGSQTISLTLAGPTELTGKRIRVTNPDGSEVNAFAFSPGTPVSAPGQTLDGVIPIFPLQSYTAAAYERGGSFSSAGVAIMNPNADAVQLLLDTTSAGGDFVGEQSLTLPPGSSLFAPLKTLGSQGGGTLILASAPVRMVAVTATFGSLPGSSSLSASPLSATTVPPLQVAQDPSQPAALSWVWQTAAAAPQVQSVSLGLPRGQPDTDLSVSTVISSGGAWLSVTPGGTIHCQMGACVTLKASVNPASLAPGIYRGTITITPVATAFRPSVAPAIIPVALTVTALPLVQTVIVPAMFFYPNNSSATVVPPPGMFSGPVSVSIATDSGGSWLSASASSTIAPTSIALTASAAGLAVGSYSGEVVVMGPGNTLIIPVQEVVDGSVRLTPADAEIGTLGALTFAAQTGMNPILTQLVPVSTEDCSPTECFNVNPDLSSLAASARTDSGGPWLRATVSQGGVLVTANSAGLAAGVYIGAVTFIASGVASGQFSVVLVIEDGPPPALVAGPGMLSFQFQVGEAVRSAPTPVCVSSASFPLTFNVQVTTSGGGGWIKSRVASATTPACIDWDINTTTLPPGTYTGNIVISSGLQSVVIPVMATVTGQPGLPLLGSAASGASEVSAAVSPGEILVIHGINLGPMTPVSGSVVQGQFSTSVSGTGISIGGIPSPILYVSPTQINTVVPYEVASQSNVTLQVHASGGSTSEWALPIVTSAPGIFTLGGGGTGDAAVLNADSSVNTPSNPAVQGTAIQIFATGEGLTNPAGKTGSIATGTNQPLLGVGVSIGGVPAAIVYQGSAPGEIEGLFQVNAVVPQGLPPGVVPILLTVGDAQSQAGTTIAVK